MEKEYFAVISDGITLVGQLLTPDGVERPPLVVLCHGAPSGNPPDPNDGGYSVLAERFRGEGFAVCFFNFRGTGDSGGNIDFYGWTRDLRAMLDYLWTLDGFDKARVYLMGSSAGAATSICVAADDARVAAVAACASPADFTFFMSRDEPAAIIEHYRAIGAIRDADFPPSMEGWFENLQKVTPERHVGKISPRPLLLVHGDRDETVPPEHARRLYAAAGEPKELVMLEGIGHRMRQEERVVRTVLDWFHGL